MLWLRDWNLTQINYYSQLLKETRDSCRIAASSALSREQLPPSTYYTSEDFWPLVIFAMQVTLPWGIISMTSRLIPDPPNGAKSDASIRGVSFFSFSIFPFSDCSLKSPRAGLAFAARTAHARSRSLASILRGFGRNKRDNFFPTIIKIIRSLIKKIAVGNWFAIASY